MYTISMKLNNNFAVFDIAFAMFKPPEKAPSFVEGDGGGGEGPGDSSWGR